MPNRERPQKNDRKPARTGTPKRKPGPESRTRNQGDRERPGEERPWKKSGQGTKPARRPGGSRREKPAFSEKEERPKRRFTKPVPQTKAPTKPAVPDLTEPVRLNRYISMAGVAARRKADELIAGGRVRINGEVVTELGTKVNPGDEVEVEGRVISPQALVYILLNKPSDTVTTVEDERDRRTVLDLIDDPALADKGLFPVGRLDRQTVGALLLTNDGELANRLMHPRYEIEKLYLVKTRDPIKPHQLDELRAGIQLEDGLAKADQVAYINPPSQHELGISLHEGRNRQIRRMLEALGHTVIHLERVSYAGLNLEEVRRGKWRHLFPHEVKKLKRQVKLK